MLTTKRKLLIATAMIPLIFAFGSANAATEKNATQTNSATIIAKGQNHLPQLAKGQNHLPKKAGDKDKHCS